MGLLRQIIRIACDPVRNAAPVNIETNNQVNIIKAVDIEIQLGLFAARTLQAVDEVVSVTCEIRATRSGAPVMSEVVLAAALDNTLDATTWANKTKQHATVRFTADETVNLTAGTAWLVVKALTNVPTTVHWVYGEILVTDAGIEATGAPAAGNPLFVTKAEFDATIAAILNGTTGFEMIKIYNQETGAFHLGRLAGQNGQTVIGWSDSQ